MRIRKKKIERLTCDEIRARFPERWVVVVDVDATSERCSAVVIGKHASRRDASADVRAAFRAYEEVGCFWTGPAA